ncbi:MAG TPA: hypothetical protein PKW95_14965 [bacterium]|mgnify:CR=1 FL=1|nr:hypothetical protein [bacterium]
MNHDPKKIRHIAAAVVGWILLLYCLGLILDPPFSFRHEMRVVLFSGIAALLLLPLAIALVWPSLRHKLDINLFPRRKTD